MYLGIFEKIINVIQSLFLYSANKHRIARSHTKEKNFIRLYLIQN